MHDDPVDAVPLDVGEGLAEPVRDADGMLAGGGS
jgi:hypothetical protein